MVHSPCFCVVGLVVLTSTHRPGSCSCMHTCDVQCLRKHGPVRHACTAVDPCLLKKQLFLLHCDNLRGETISHNSFVLCSDHLGHACLHHVGQPTGTPGANDSKERSARTHCTGFKTLACWSGSARTAQEPWSVKPLRMLGTRQCLLCRACLSVCKLYHRCWLSR